MILRVAHPELRHWRAHTRMAEKPPYVDSRSRRENLEFAPLEDVTDPELRLWRAQRRMASMPYVIIRYGTGEREGVWHACHTPKQSTAKARAAKRL